MSDDPYLFAGPVPPGYRDISDRLATVVGPNFQEGCAKVGVSMVTLRAWIPRGLPYCRVGRTPHFLADGETEAWIARNRDRRDRRRQEAAVNKEA
jgi:hypothetical protein